MNEPDGKDRESGAKDKAASIDFGKRVFVMRHPALSQVEAYWEGLRGTRIAPLRSEVDPRGIDRALEHAFILERIAPGVARFRLAGMHLNDLMGMEVRGMPLTSFFTPTGRPAVSDALGHVFEQPAKAEFDLRGERGQAEMTGQMILLPLRSDLGDISRALGCLITNGQIRRAPHRFEIAGSRIEPLAEGQATVRPAQYALRPKPAAGTFAEERPAYDNRAPRPIPARPGHLRLVSDNEKKR